jgi:predicted permease
LGIGANLTVFLIFYGVIGRPLPFPDPQQLVRVQRFYPDGTLVPAYSGTKALFFTRTSRVIDSAAAYDYVPSNVNLVQGDVAVPLRSLGVTANFFHVFGMEPELGRGFAAADMAPNAAPVVVISDATWRQRFAADSNVAGRVITLGNEEYTVVGVASRRFELDRPIDVWLPLHISETPGDQANDFNFVARLKAGVTMAQAEDDLKRVLFEFKNTYPALWNQYESVRVIDFHDSIVGQIRPSLEMLMGAVSLLLLIVSANILSLLLTRSIARHREVGLRAALGAPEWRILQQLLIENLTLCVIGGVAAILFAKFATPLLLHLSPIELPQFTTLDFGAAGFIFASLLVIGCALLFSLVPMREARRGCVNDSLRSSPAQMAAARNLYQRALVVGEVALSLILLTGAGLLLTSFWRLFNTRSGFDERNLVTFKTSFNTEQAGDSATLGRNLTELIDQIQELPGVHSVAAAMVLPTQTGPDLPFDVIGRPAGTQGSGGDEKYVPITANYFAALRIPVLKGRPFSSSDEHNSTPVVIVNQEFAHKYFPAENPIGRNILIGAAMGPGFEDNPREIIGVVGNTKQDGLDKPDPGVMYVLVDQVPDALTRLDVGHLGMSWIVRVRSSQLGLVDPLRQIFSRQGRIPLLGVETMQDLMGASVAQQRFSMLLLSIFGLISLALGAAGLYGVMSYSVARQTKEIGIRMALGAQPRNISQMVLREALLLVGCGLAVGVIVSVAGAQLLRSLLFGVTPHDPITFISAVAVLLIVGLLAAWWPARRAAKVDPMVALRYE